MPHRSALYSWVGLLPSELVLGLPLSFKTGLSRLSTISPSVNVSVTWRFDLCYNGGGAKYVLPQESSSISNQKDGGGLVCLAFKSAWPAGSMSIFGNIQQQNFHIVYDLGHKKLQFAPTNCASI